MLGVFQAKTLMSDSITVVKKCITPGQESTDAYLLRIIAKILPMAELCLDGWLCTCIELVSLSARMHFNTSIFWKSSKSLSQCPGSGSLCGSTLSNIFLNPSACSLNSSANFAKLGRAGSVSMSFQTLSEIHCGAGLASVLGMVVPPAIRWRHSSCVAKKQQR